MKLTLLQQQLLIKALGHKDVGQITLRDLLDVIYQEVLSDIKY